MEQLLIDIKPNRSVSDVYINQKMDLTNLVKFIEKKKKMMNTLLISMLF